MCILKHTGNMSSFCKDNPKKNGDTCIAIMNILIFSFIISFKPFFFKISYLAKYFSVCPNSSGQTLCGKNKVDFSEAVIRSFKRSKFICQKPYVDLV